MSEPLQRVLPLDDGQICHNYVFCCPCGPGGGRVDGQPATWVLLGLVLINIRDLEVGGPLDGPEMWSKCRDFARVLLLAFMRLILGRGAGSMSSQPSSDRASSRGRSRLNSSGLTSSRDTMVPVILLPAPYLTFVPSVA
jgi:hypothetical protein